MAAQLVLTLALGTALHAFGAHFSLAALIIVVTVAGTAAGLSPGHAAGCLVCAERVSGGAGGGTNRARSGSNHLPRLAAGAGGPAGTPDRAVVMAR